MSSDKIEVRLLAASSAAGLRKRVLQTTLLAVAMMGGAFAAIRAGSGTNSTPLNPAVVEQAAPTATYQFGSRTVPTPTSTPTPSQSLSLGINVASSNYYGTERTFANLAFATGAWRNPLAGWADVPKDKLTPGGTPLIYAALMLNVPQTVWAGKATPIKCTWTGSGTIRVDGDARLTGSNHAATFTWPGSTGKALPTVILYVDSVNKSDPLANLDCREPNLATKGAFDQRIVDDLKPYGILRFLDWSNANSNPASVTWATRATPARLVQDGNDGIALEHMVDLANAVGADPWFTIPWNADETYVRAMAKLVHDRLATGHRAYFELSNETWNYAFPVANQVLNEGIGEGLSSDRYTNGLLRYAEKSIWFHKLLTNAFQDNPARLVRVLNMQNGNGWSIEQVMGFRDTPQWVDAIATAPYFGHDLLRTVHSGVTDLPTLFAALETMRVAAIDHAVADKAIAAKWNKRYLAYEGGQHIVPLPENAAVAAQMQRSPLMHDMYQRYLADWRMKIGDTLTLYSATGFIGQYGAWGIREYAGQPLTDSPKRRAVLEAASPAP